MTRAVWTREVLLPFLITRAALLAAGVLALGLIGSVRDRMPGNLLAHETAPAPLEIWTRWDAEWYLLIAERGYRADEALAPYGRYAPGDTTGFFPLYPLLIRAVASTGIPPAAAGWLIANLALLAALTLLHRLVAEASGGAAAAGSVLCLLAFPPSLFLSALYAESLGLALSLAAFTAAGRARWGGMALASFLAALARPTGWLVAPALAWEVGRARAGWKGWTALAAAPAGTAVFSLYCLATFGDPLSWAARQERWRGALGGPWRAFVRFFEEGPRLHGAHGSMVELGFALFFVAALVPVFRTQRRSWAVYALLVVLVPLSTSLWSFGRLALAAFPVFAWAGGALARRPGPGWPLIASGFVLGGVWMVLFACGWWTG